MNIETIYTDKPLNEPAVRLLRENLSSGSLIAGAISKKIDIQISVSKIISDVCTFGDDGVINWVSKLDKVELTSSTLRVDVRDIDKAHREAEPAFLTLIRRVIANIREYQQSILIPTPPPLRRGSRELGVRYTPVDRACVYVPGGRALYPSTVLMTVVPAQVAGVKEIVMASPPSFKGDIHPMVLALAGELGVTEVYRVGGAVAIAAMAYGTGSIRAVDKIVGPGNAFVAEAKRQVLGQVGIDSIAGPSEVFIIADDAAPAAYVAADMLAQAEHDPGSAVLATPSRKLAEAVKAELETQLATLSRRDATAAALEKFSAIIVVPDIAAACELANDFATEHLQIMTADDDAALARIRNAGAIFVGSSTPVPLGDYYAGPSHVLPTGSTARFFSPLSCNDFRKSSSVIRYGAAATNQDAADVIDFATREGLTGHAAAVKKRQQTRD